MNITRHTIQACCGKSSIIFKTDQSISTYHLSELFKYGFNEHKHFTKAGILYVDNNYFVITGPIGSDRLQIKCKIDDCSIQLNELELILQKI